MKKNTVFARIMALILIVAVALIPMLAQTTASAASGVNYADYDLSNPSSASNVELDVEYFVELLGGSSPVGDIEREYLNEKYSYINVKYDEPKADKFDITALNNTVTITAEPYTYTASNGTVATWNPVSATIEGTNTAVTFTQSGGKYVANISGVNIDNNTAVNVKYEIAYTFVIDKDDLNAAFNYTYDEAQRIKAEYLAAEAEYAAKMEEYQDYLDRQANIDEAIAKYEQYLEDLAAYQEELAAYNTYLEKLAAYQEKVDAYNEYLKKLEEYNTYVNYTNLYPGLLDEYNLNVVAYREYCAKMDTIKAQLAIFDTGLFENVTTLERQLYSCIIGDTVNSVLNRKEEIVAGVPSAESAIDDAGRATQILKSILGEYVQIEDEANKYAFYIANYTAIKDNIILLAQTLYDLYRYDIVRTGVHTGVEGSGGKTDKYVIMVSQLILFANAISDETVYSYPGSKHDQIVLNKSTTIEYLTGELLPYKKVTKTALQILENNEYVTDSNSATPLSGGYPQHMEEPVAPVHPNDITPVTKPTLVRKPGNPPTVVEEPVRPEEVTDPRLESMDEPKKPAILDDTHSIQVIAALNNGTIAKRDTVSEDYTFTPTVNLSKKVINDENVVVTFYGNDRSTVLTRVITSLYSTVVYSGTTPTKQSTETEDYTFKGWVDANGNSVDLNVVRSDLALYPSYNVTSYAIVKFFDTDRTTLLSTLKVKKGSAATYNGKIPTKIDDLAVHTFAGWVDANGNDVNLSQVTSSVDLYPKFTSINYIYVNFYNTDRSEILYTDKILPGQSAPYSGDTPVKENTLEIDYKFAGWVDASGKAYKPESDSFTTAIDLYPSFTATTYVIIRFFGTDGSEIEYYRVRPGTSVNFKGNNPAKENTAEIDYAFSGWTDNAGKTFAKGAAVSSDISINLYPTFTETKYVIVEFYDSADPTKLLESYRVRPGTLVVFKGTVPTKASTDTIDYGFSHWVDKDGNSYDLRNPQTSVKLYPAFNETYYAVVRFFDTNEVTILDRQRIPLYSSVTYSGSKTPVKAADDNAVYTFAGWVDVNGNAYNLSRVAGSIDLYPTFNPTYYIYINFYDTDNSEILYTAKILPGQSAHYSGEAPVKENTLEVDYKFAGWVDASGKAYKPESVAFTASLDLYPTFTATNYVIIRFFDTDGSEICYERVLPGTAVSFAGTEPTKESIPEADYFFRAWTDNAGKTFAKGTQISSFESLNLYPDFDTVEYIVIKFYGSEYGSAENTVLEEKRVRPGTTVTYSGTNPEKPDEPEFGYLFAGWRTADGDEFDLSAPVVSMDLYPIFAVTDFIILNFYDVDNNPIVLGVRIPKGKEYAYDGEVPTKESEENIEYEFSYWADQSGVAYDFAATQYSTDLYPVFREIRYVTIRFFNTDGTLIETQERVRVGSEIAFGGDIPTKEATDEADYIFAGWQDASDVRHYLVPDTDTDLYPYFDITRYVVISFLDADGTVLHYERVLPGSIVTITNKIPVKPNEELKDYSFAGWRYDDGTAVGAVISSNESINIYPVFNSIEYAWVRFLDLNGNLLEKLKVRLGASVEYSGEVPQKPSTDLEDYIFFGWVDKDGEPADLSNITESIDFSPAFDTITYVRINFYDTDAATLLLSLRVRPDVLVSYGEKIPVKGTSYHENYEIDYTFSGWTDNNGTTFDKGDEISSQDSIDLYPTFAKTKFVVVEFYNEASEMLDSYRVQPGTAITFKGTNPTKESTDEIDYIFSHWVDIDANAYDLNNPQSSVKLYPAFDEFKYAVIKFYDTDGSTLLEEYRTPIGMSVVFMGTDPVKESTDEIDYIFAYWVDEAGNEYDLGNPQFSAKLTPYFTEEYFAIVKFHDINGEIIGEPHRIPVGTSVEFADTLPVKPEDYYGVYTFSHWMNADGEQCDLNNIDQSIDLYPSFTVRPYLDVIFYAFDRVTVLNTQRVLLGNSVTYGGNTPVRDIDEHGRYSFAHWVDANGEALDLGYIGESVELYPEFNLTPYIVITFVGADGVTVLDTQKIFPGEGPVVYGGIIPTKPSIPEADYTFSGVWLDSNGDDFDLIDPTESATVYPDFLVTPYIIVNFYACDGVTVLESLRQRPGQKIVYSKDTPVKASTDLAVYEFSGWTYVDGTAYNFERLSESTDIYPAFREIPYVTITFLGVDGESVLYSFKILQGAEVVYGAELPVKESDTDYAYSFAHWAYADGSVYDFSSSATVSVRPVFNSIPYFTVTFFGLDGVTVLDTQRVLMGTEVVFAGTLPTRESDLVYDYFFGAWVDADGDEYDLSSVAGNVNLYATLESVLRDEYEIVEDETTGLREFNVDLGDIDLSDIPLAAFIAHAAENRTVLNVTASDVSVRFAYTQVSAMLAAKVASISVSFEALGNAARANAPKLRAQSESGVNGYVCVLVLKDEDGEVLDVSATATITVDCQDAEKAELYSISYVDAEGEEIDVAKQTDGSIISFIGQNNVTYTFRVKYDVNVSPDLPLNMDVSVDTAAPGDTVTIILSESVPPGTILTVYYYDANSVKHIIEGDSFVMPEGYVLIGMELVDIIYTVTFISDGMVLSENKYKYGETVIVPRDPVKQNDDLYSYTFAGWSEDITIVTGDIIYEAKFDAELLPQEDDSKNVYIELFEKHKETFKKIGIVLAVILVLCIAVFFFLIVKGNVSFVFKV